MARLSIMRGDACPGRIVSDARLLVVAGQPAGAQPELDPALGEEVEGGHLLGQDDRVPVVVVEDQGAHPEVGGGLGGDGESDQRAVLIVEVVGNEQRRVSEVLDLAGRGPPGRGRVGPGQLDSEPERWHGPSLREGSASDRADARWSRGWPICRPATTDSDRRNTRRELGRHHGVRFIEQGERDDVPVAADGRTSDATPAATLAPHPARPRPPPGGGRTQRPGHRAYRGDPHRAPGGRGLHLAQRPPPPPASCLHRDAHRAARAPQDGEHRLAVRALLPGLPCVPGQGSAAPAAPPARSRARPPHGGDDRVGHRPRARPALGPLAATVRAQGELRALVRRHDPPRARPPARYRLGSRPPTSWRARVDRSAEPVCGCGCRRRRWSPG